MHQHAIAVIFDCTTHQLCGAIGSNPDAKIRLHRSHIRISVERDIAHVVCRIASIRSDTAHGDVLRRLAFSAFSTGNKGLFKDIPNLIGFDKKHGH